MNFNLEIRSPSLVRDENYKSNSYVNHILRDRYFRTEFSETIFRAIHVEMSMLFREYYATSPKCPIASNRSQNHLLTIFFAWIDAYSKYLSTNLILFNLIRIARDINFLNFLELILFILFVLFQNTGIDRRPRKSENSVIADPQVVATTQRCWGFL